MGSAQKSERRRVIHQSAIYRCLHALARTSRPPLEYFRSWSRSIWPTFSSHLHVYLIEPLDWAKKRQIGRTNSHTKPNRDVLKVLLVRLTGFLFESSSRREVFGLNSHVSVLLSSWTTLAPVIADFQDTISRLVFHSCSSMFVTCFVLPTFPVVSKKVRWWMQDDIFALNQSVKQLQ